MSCPLYVQFQLELRVISVDTMKLDWQSILSTRPIGISAFLAISGFFKSKSYNVLHELDMITYDYARKEDASPPIPDTVVNVNCHPTFEDWKKSFLSFMDRWQNKDWKEMPHGVPTLRHLNRCLRLNSNTLMSFELSILKIQEKYRNSEKKIEENTWRENATPISSNVCNSCSSTKNLMRCAACKVVWYCSRDCQKQDWIVHKLSCKK